jgi:hypothetical protein
MNKSYLAAISFAFSLPMSATTYAQGACQINLNGIFHFAQPNTGGTLVTMNLNQNGNTISGTATGGGNGKVSNGTLAGRKVTLTITWPSGTQGLYSWTIDSSGALAEGLASDLNHPESASALTSNSNFCQ